MMQRMINLAVAFLTVSQALHGSTVFGQQTTEKLNADENQLAVVEEALPIPFREVSQTSPQASPPSSTLERSAAGSNALTPGNAPRTTPRPVDSSIGRYTAQTNLNSGSRNAGRSLSSIPYMVGDTTGGGCGAIQMGGVTALLIAHPTYGCSRLNIAENNSPVVADRVYASYRHFHNATEVDIFSFAPTGGRNTLAIDTVTLGIERKITEESSIELRLPVHRQLASDLTISQVTGPVSTLPLNDRETTIGNMGLIFKRTLFQNCRWYFSGGVALNLPTASDVLVNYGINDAQFQLIGPGGNPIGQTFPLNFNLFAQRTNETVNLSPFFSSYYRPNSSTYLLGFLQFDTPLNQSTIRTNGSTLIFGQPVAAFNVNGRIDQQTLLRCNLGGGKWLWQQRHDRLFHSCSLLGEMHYTTTLNDADIVGPIAVAPNLGTGVPLLSFGNVANRVDSLNATLGTQAVLGKTVITNGFIAPLRSGPDRGYDFEYSLSFNRLF